MGDSRIPKSAYMMNPTGTSLGTNETAAGQASVTIGQRASQTSYSNRVCGAGSLS